MRQLTFLHIIVLIGLTQALFLALVLSHRQHKRHGERWLIALLILLAIEMAYLIYYDTGIYQLVPWLIGQDSATFLLYGPLLWFFMRRMAQEPLPRRLPLCLHFVPAALIQLNALFYYTLNPENVDFIAILDQGWHGDAPSAWDLDDFVEELLIGAYLIACWRVWRRYRDRVEAEQAQWQRTGLDWMRQVLLAFSFLWGLLLARDQILIWWGWGEAIDRMIYVALPMTIFYLAYRLWQQEPKPLVLMVDEPRSGVTPADISLVQEHLSETQTLPLSGQPLSQASPEETPSVSTAADAQEVVRKYAKSALDDASAASIFDALETLMRDGQPWRDPELDLVGLANRLELSPHYLSQAINSRASRNFYDYVNRYRVEAVQRVLAQADTGSSILDLAFAAGFNSKSAFYTAFKRYTGLTPRDYQHQTRQ